MKGMAAALLALLTTACSAAGPNGAAEKGNAATAAGAAAATPDCPEAELSCGRQRPVVSDGSTPVTNTQMFLRAVFPAGSPVCMTRSGNAPRGFFTMLDGTPGCPERPERPPRFIVLNAAHNALEHRAIRQALPDPCPPLSAGIRHRLGSAPLALPGRETVICERRPRAGEIELSLYFLGGPGSHETEVRNRWPGFVYDFHLATTDAHFDRDLARFRTVLASVRISGEAIPEQGDRRPEPRP